MNKIIRLLLIPVFFLGQLFAGIDTVSTVQLSKYKLYPDYNSIKPQLPSPFVNENGEEFVVAFTKFGTFAVIPVTLNDQHDIAPQLFVDTLDFPLLARYGLHDDKLLNAMTTITGWDLDTITALGRPGNLSSDGFLAKDEDIRSVLIRDNDIVTAMGLTHPQLAKPLFHLLNIMEADLKLHRWNMAKHKWEHIKFFYYNGHEIHVEAEDTKGGQMSMFNDGIEGAFFIQIRRRAEPQELALLANIYHDLPTEEYEVLKSKLFGLNTGEMEPQYIMRYGFYEGHTYWRADPIAIALIFGLKDLAEVEEIFKGELYDVMTGHAVAQP
jgi:hypothetical protein